jgi:hypothetical protein
MEYLYRPAGRCRLALGSVISCGLNAARLAASKRAMRVGTGAAAVGAKRLLASATQDRCSRRERIHDGKVGFVKKKPFAAPNQNRDRLPPKKSKSSMGAERHTGFLLSPNTGDESRRD